MEKRVYNIAKNYKDNLKDYIPFATISNPSAYDALPDNVKDRLISDGEKYLSYDYPIIKATDFMNFKRTGNRDLFESKYFTRRNALNSLVLAECVEHNGRFMDDIINGVFTLCEESGWQLPAHNSYERDVPQYILPDAFRPVMDLFACETGAQLACIAYLLKDEFEKISPFILERIEGELQTRIISPYVNSHFWWMGYDDEPMCNWTVWCTQNVLLATFLTPWQTITNTMNSLQHDVFLKASASCDFFLKDYGDDGCCDEGAQYYRHAGLCLFGALEVLNTVSDNSFEELYHWDKIKNIASYILNVHVDDKYYFNFADCSPIAGRAGVREYLFGKATGQDNLMFFGAKDFQTGGGMLYTDEVNSINLFYRLQTAFLYDEVMSCDVSAPIIHNDIYYPSVGLFLVHSPRLSLAVKAGDNNDSHNHNDTGSITLYKDGLPILADIGVETYTQKTFSPNRYEIWTMQSGYHNLPTICGTDQHDGKEYCASMVDAHPFEENPYISMELSGAYPLSDISYTRHVTLLRDKDCVVLCDKTNAGDVVLNFITYEKPLIQANTGAQNDTNVILIGNASLNYKGASLIEIETLPITDARLKTAWAHDLYRIRLKLEGEEFKAYLL